VIRPGAAKDRPILAPEWEIGDRVALVLTYEGPLPSRNAESGNRIKNQIRRTLHPQLVNFCRTDAHFAFMVQLPGGGRPDFRIGGIRFLPVVMGTLVCDLNIEVLRRDMPGSIFNGGDLDGRLKTLLDGLRKPHSPDEMHGFDITGDPEQDQCFVLLADDSLITKVQIETHRLLRPLRDNESKTDVEVRIRAEIREERVPIL
jgi:hypothetical protein